VLDRALRVQREFPAVSFWPRAACLRHRAQSQTVLHLAQSLPGCARRHRLHQNLS
jgi:hypothetical protein